MNGKHSNMLMDTGIYKMEKNQVEVALDYKKESAFLLLDGKVEIEWQGSKEVMERHSIFDEDPWCLHVPRNVEVKITALTDAEVLIQKTTNDKEFICKFYAPEDCQSDIFGEGVWNDTARRVVRRSEEHTSELQSRQYLVCRL